MNIRVDITFSIYAGILMKIVQQSYHGRNRSVKVSAVVNSANMIQYIIHFT